MRISEKLFDHKRKADASMPVAAGNECCGGVYLQSFGLSKK